MTKWQLRKSKVMAKTGGQCAYCGATATCVDHAHALSEGGGDEIENLLPACLSCNARKGSKYTEDFRRFLTLEKLGMPMTAREEWFDWMISQEPFAEVLEKELARIGWHIFAHEEVINATIHISAD